MERKGVSVFIGIVFAIIISFIAAGIFLMFGKELLLGLGPVLPCQDVNFEAGFYYDSEEGTYYLDITNRGIDIEGALLKQISEDKVVVFEEYDQVIRSKESVSILIESISGRDVGKRFLVVPKIRGEDVQTEVVRECGDEFGYELVF